MDGQLTFSEGWAVQITLPSGKFLYTGVGSVIATIAEEKGMEHKIVRYHGACDSIDINGRVHEGFPVDIDDVPAGNFIGQIATREECGRFID